MFKKSNASLHTTPESLEKSMAGLVQRYGARLEKIHRIPDAGQRILEAERFSIHTDRLLKSFDKIIEKQARRAFFSTLRPRNMKQAGALAGRLLAGGVIMLLPVPAVSTILIGSLVKLEVMKVEERLRKSHAEPLKTLKAQHMQASDMVHNMLRQHAHSVSSSDSYSKLLNHPRIKDYFESVSVRVVHVTTYGELMARAAVLPSPSGKKPG